MQPAVKSPGRGRPAKPEHRVQEKAAVRASILAAARLLIVRDGFRALSIRKLSAAVRYSPGAIYLYFPSREAIARELCLGGYRDLLVRLREAARPEAGPEANLHALFTAYLEFGLAEPETYRLIFMEEPEYLAAVFAERPADDPATRAYELLVDAARALLSPGSRAPRSPTSAVTLAEACWAAMHGIVSLKLSCPAFLTTSPAELCQLILAGLRRGGVAG